MKIIVLLLIMSMSINKKYNKYRNKHRKNKIIKRDEVPSDSVVFMAYDTNGNLVKNVVKKD